jgi:hypothetical protein
MVEEGDMVFPKQEFDGSKRGSNSCSTNQIDTSPVDGGFSWNSEHHPPTFSWSLVAHALIFVNHSIHPLTFTH